MNTTHLKAGVLLVILLTTAPHAWADRTVTSVPENGPYTTTGTLTATCTVDSGKEVYFGATTQIVLKPGFHAASGSNFCALAGTGAIIGADTDADGDQYPDWWEFVHYGSIDWNTDSDGDYYADWWELAYHGSLDWNTKDSDADGIPDILETQYGSDPLDAASKPQGVIHYEYDELGRITRIYRF